MDKSYYHLHIDDGEWWCDGYKDLENLLTRISVKYSGEVIQKLEDIERIAIPWQSADCDLFRWFIACDDICKDKAYQRCSYFLSKTEAHQLLKMDISTFDDWWFQGLIYYLKDEGFSTLQTCLKERLCIDYRK